jgi:phosphate transport system substrate-binding protein
MARWSRFARPSAAVATVGLLLVLLLTACGGGSATATTAPAPTASRAAGASPAASSAAATTAPTTAAASAGSATTAPTAAATAAPSGTTAASPVTSGTAAAGSATSGTTTAGGAAGAQPKGPATCTDGSIIALGSTAIQPLAEAAAKAYTAKCPNAKINVQGGGSGTGLTQVSQGGATIGNSDIFAEEGSGIDAKALVDHQVAVQGFAMAANPGVKVDSLTQDQVIAIFTGKTTNWKDVGGSDLKIVVVNRPASSGTRATFRKYALKGQAEAQGLALTEDSSGAVSKAILDTPGAIGYLGLAYFVTNKDLKIVKFNGKDPSVANISDDSYPIWSYAHMYTKGEATGLAKAFIDYVLSDDIQTTLIPQLGYIPAAQVKAKHTPT